MGIMTYNHTIDGLAEELGAQRDDIVVLVDQIADDSDLYDEDTETISDAGAELIRDQMSGGLNE
jgi:hypothetical protein